MRISDWSSDVCSSDLDRELGRRLLAVQLGDAVAPELWPLHRHPGEGGRDNRAPVQGAGGRRRHAGGRPTLSPWRGGRGAPRAGGPPHPRLHHPPAGRATMTDRSEEHTSELQSLMRISYAVFCLNKKTIIVAHI